MISNMYEIIQERDQLKVERDKLEAENKELKHENKELRLQSDTYFEQWQQCKEERDTQEALKIAFARSYKQVVEDNEELKEEIKKLKGED